MIIFREPVIVKELKNELPIYPINEFSGNKSFFETNSIPSDYRNTIKNDFINIVGKKLIITFDNLKNIGNQKSIEILENNLKSIKNFIKNIDINLERIKTMEAQQEIADIGLAGFEIKLNLEKGLQLNLKQDMKNNLLFFDIVRKYIFDYKDSNWPPKDIDYFIYNNPKKEICCFFWPLYAYVKTLFYQDFKGSIDISDIFILSRMKTYCADFFPRYKNKSVKQYGGKNKNSKSKPTGKDIPVTSKPKPIGKNIPVTSDALNCDSSKLKRIQQSLMNTKVKIKIDDIIIEDTEYNSLRNLVSGYIRNSTTESQLLFGNYESLMEIIKEFNQDRKINFTEKIPSSNAKKYTECKHLKSPSGTTRILFDPLTGSSFTFNNMKAWISPVIISKPKSKSKNKNMEGGKKKDKNKKQKQKQEKITVENICVILQNGFNKFKNQYPLSSPMWRLDEEILTKVRTRFMKFLVFLLTSLKNMYQNIINKFDEKDQKLSNVKKFYIELINLIKNEKDPEKRKQYIELKREINKKK